MPSGWEVYYVILLAAVLASMIPFANFLVSRVIFREKAPPPAVPPQVRLGWRMNGRFFLAGSAALVLTGLAILLIPCVTVFQQSEANGGSLITKGVFAVLTLSGFAGIGLFYSARKGNLDWLRTYRKEG